MKFVTFANASKYFFFASVGLAIFAWGVATARYGIFPNSVIERAKIGIEALRESTRDARLDRDRFEKPETDEPLSGPRGRWLVADHATDPEHELILLAGGTRFLDELHPPDGCMAWISDRKGNVQHVWKGDQTFYDTIVQESGCVFPLMSGIPNIVTVGMHLFSNGDLLATFCARRAFPYTTVIAKFDRESKLLWKVAEHNHHWFSVDEIGQIHVPCQTTRDAPYRLSNSRILIESKTGKLFDDGIMILSPDGKVLDRFSVLEALVESGYAPVLNGTRVDSANDPHGERLISATDPVHLNDIRLVTEDDVNFDKSLAVGDYLISLREPGAIAILDRGTHRVKWLSTGTTEGQHSPRFYDGGILVFDNWGGDERLGGTRLALIDADRASTRTLFPRPEVSLPAPFFSWEAGHIDLHPDGRRALIASTTQGAVWEVDLTTGAVLWEYGVPFSRTYPKNRRRIHTAKYCDKLGFPLNQATAANHAAGE